jgi:TRAP-type C4-dicarboxylate transport system substrate-binding protein
MQSINLTWVLAHEPYEVFHKAARHFAQEVAAETNGRITITVLDLPDYNAVAGTTLTSRTPEHRKAVIDGVNSGQMDMATTYVNNLAAINRDLYAWGLPYLFSNADQAQTMLDGEIGKALLAGVAARSNIKPLAYTFSGGFRTMPSNVAIETMADFRNLKIRCTNHPVSVDMFESLDATAVTIPTEDFGSALISGEVDSGEATYPRFFLLGYDKASKVINHTEHNLFLTSIVINQNVWNSFDAETQDIFTRAAHNAALMERAESLASVEQVQRDAAALGIPTVIMKEAEKAKLAASFAPLYDKYQTWFSPGVVSGLRGLH